MYDDVDDNDGGTVMTMSSTLKNNDVYTTHNDAIDINPIAKSHKFSVSHRKTETKRYDTETDCFFFSFLLQSFSIVHCEWLLLLLLVSMDCFC